MNLVFYISEDDSEIKLTRSHYPENNRKRLINTMFCRSSFRKSDEMVK